MEEKHNQQIIDDFKESWKQMEYVYEKYSTDYPYKESTFRLIHEMRALHLDEKLRAGQMLSHIVLSRNRYDGLDLENEPYLLIVFLGNHEINVVTNNYGQEKNQKQEATYNGYLKEMIQKLITKDIIWNKEWSQEPDPFFDSFE